MTQEEYPNVPREERAREKEEFMERGVSALENDESWQKFLSEECTDDARRSKMIDYISARISYLRGLEEKLSEDNGRIIRILESRLESLGG